ncbi:MAG: YraN family protein [Acidimicrobiales bacterium]
MTPPELSGRAALGASGEDAAARWYEAAGYTIVARNWRCRDGELDVIAEKGRLYVFCEVKTRRSVAFGLPVEAVDRRKQLRIRRLAARWLAEAAPARGRPIRFDVASVRDGVVDVIEDAF